MDIPNLPNFDFLKFNKESAIPVPTTEHLQKIKAVKPRPSFLNKSQKPLVKYEREYDAYCRWCSLPDELKKPKTVYEFEKKWHIPKSWSATFRQREDFRDRTFKYFWDWLMDIFPDVVYASYKQIQKTGNANHVKILADLISKHMDIGKPAQVIQPFMMIGVPQEKIDRLFMPKGFEKVEDILPEREVK